MSDSQMRIGEVPREATARTDAFAAMLRWASRAIANAASRVWQPRARRLRLCETVSLGNRGFIAVVQCEQEEFLVGGTAGSIALLAKLAPERPARAQGISNSEAED